MISNAAAYYYWPGLWVGSRPPGSSPFLDITTLGDEVYRTSLPGSIEVKVLREGMFIFDFSGWPPGRSLPEGDIPNDFDAIATVILRRVAILNAHLACLYTAFSQRQNSQLE